MKVDFMIIGAMKSGTTTLSYLLRHHPQVVFSSIKEPDFFSKTENWRADLENYSELFEQGKGKIRGEGSTTYTKYPALNLEIWQDIYEYNSAMKFIYIVRDPVDRAVSQYMHMYEVGLTDLNLEDAIRNIPSMINNGRYFIQIQPFVSRFGRENVLILDFEDLVYSQGRVLREVADFLQIDSGKFQVPEAAHFNPSLGGHRAHIRNEKFLNLLRPYRRLVPERLRHGLWRLLSNSNKRRFYEKPQLSEEMKRVILNLTCLDIIELERLTGRDFSRWLKPVIRSERAPGTLPDQVRAQA